MAEVFFIPFYSLILMRKFLWNECHLYIKANQHQSSFFYNVTDLITIRPIVVNLSEHIPLFLQLGIHFFSLQYM